MISLNKAMILGNVTRDPELRYIPSGQAVCNFSIATNRRFKNAQGDLQEDTQYHDIVVWGKLAEIVTQILSKGSKVYVDGRLQTRQWDAPDGSKRSRTEIVLEQFIPLTPKSGGAMPVSDTGATIGKAPEIAEVKPTEKAKKTAQENAKQDIGGEPAVSADDDINLDDIPF